MFDFPFILNFSSEANINQVSAEITSDPCQYDFGRRSSIEVCIDPLAENYFPMADINSNLYNSIVASNVSINNDECQFIYGCTDPFAYNYDFEAGIDDGSCVQYDELTVGCLNEDYLEFDSLAVIQNELLCITILIEGCTDQNAINVDFNANIDDASCYYNYIPGCTYENAQNFDPLAILDDGSCLLTILGCTDVNSFNFNSSATQDDDSCIPISYGCTNPLSLNFDPQANTDDYSCQNILYGCTDSSSINYNYLANTDDGTCIDVVEGCTDPFAYNSFNSSANVDDGSCEYLTGGCTDELYLEFDPNAHFADGSCETLIIPGCINSLFLEFDPLANFDNNSCETFREEGCTYELADNFNPISNVNDNSCVFDGVNVQLDLLNEYTESGIVNPIIINLNTGWNMIGYTSQEIKSPEAAFNFILSNEDFTDPINIVKDVTGSFWSPQYSMLGNLIPGYGYMVFMNYTIPEFTFQQD